MATEIKEEIKKDELPDLETLIAKAKREYALKHYELAAEFYATACENYAKEVTPATVDIWYLYGCALLEYAVVSSNVLGNDGKGGEEEPEEPEPKGKAAASGRFVFGADGEGDEDPAVDLFAQAEAAVKAEDEEEKQEAANEEEEPEDDFENAWEALELVKNVYETMDDEESQLKLAETYMALGDVSLETEKFDQAQQDYEAGLNVKTKLLPIHNRQIADAHFRLSLAFDMAGGRLQAQLEHATKALESVRARLKLLKELLPKAPESKPSAPEADAKGKGKATATAENPLGWTPKRDPIDTMTKSEIETEIKDVQGLAEELEAKLEDIRSQPNDPVAVEGGSIQEKVDKLLDKELNGFGASAVPSNAPVNDLSGMVKKKKPKAPAAANPLVPDAAFVNPLVPDAKKVNPLVPDVGTLPSLGKRKAEEDTEPEGKKQRTE